MESSIYIDTSKVDSQFRRLCRSPQTFSRAIALFRHVCTAIPSNSEHAASGENAAGFPPICVYIACLEYRRPEEMSLAMAHSTSGLSISTFEKTLEVIRGALNPSFPYQLSGSTTYETLVHTELAQPAVLAATTYDSAILLMHDIEEIILNDTEFHDRLHLRYDLVIVTVFCWVCAWVKIYGVNPTRLKEKYEISAKDFDNVTAILDIIGTFLDRALADIQGGASGKRPRDSDGQNDDAHSLLASEAHISKKTRTLEQTQALDVDHPKVPSKGDGSNPSESRDTLFSPIPYNPNETSAANQAHGIRKAVPPKCHKTQSQSTVQPSHPRGGMLMSPPNTASVSSQYPPSSKASSTDNNNSGSSTQMNGKPRPDVPRTEVSASRRTVDRGMQTIRLTRKSKSSCVADTRSPSDTSHIPPNPPYIPPKQTILSALPSTKFLQVAVQTIAKVPRPVAAKVSQAVQTSQNLGLSVPTKFSQAVQTSQLYPEITKNSIPLEYIHNEPSSMKLRHLHFWAADGSVVIDVHNTLFKLHRSRLAQQSDYFTNLFHDSVHDHDGRMEDGCPVYTVDCVSIADFEQLLTTMDDAILYVRNPPSCQIILSIFRASRNLSFRIQYDYATVTLGKMWPRDLSFTAALDRSDDALATIILARKYRIPQPVLKVAFYELLRSKNFNQRVRDAAQSKTTSDLLSLADVLLLSSVREKLISLWVLVADLPPAPDVLLCPLAIAKPSNTKRIECEAAHHKRLVTWEILLKKSGVFTDCLCDPLRGLQWLIQVNWPTHGFCDGCAKLRCEAWLKKKEKLWHDLDEWLELGK